MIYEGYRRFPKITLRLLKITKIAEDYLKTSEDFRKLAKVAEDESKISELFQKEYEHFRKS